MASDQEKGGPPTTLRASADASLLSEEDLFKCRLHKPTTKTANHSYPTHKSGSIPFNYKQVEIVPLETFLKKHGQFQGRSTKVPNTLPPVDWRNKLFSESDNRSDLRDKVYLPLSRVLAPRGIIFGQDSDHVHKEGSEDSVVVKSDGEVRVVIEEESESLIKTLMPTSSHPFAHYCIKGRKLFVQGSYIGTSSAMFACPLILSQLLGYMYSSHVCRGIFTTAGRAVFVWIDPVNKKRKQRAKKPRVDKKIYVTEELFVDHTAFLRVMASFLVESFEIDSDEGAEAAALLNVSSEHGGFKDGGTQKHTPKDKVQGEDGRDSKPAAKPSSGKTKGKKGMPRAETTLLVVIPHLSQIPDFKEESIMATTLGRERRGKVIGAEWNGIPVAVKLVNIDGDDRQYARDLFHTEVEAYKLAGAAGLWGKAVPGPVFVVETDSVCALGMVQGMPMPLYPLEWTVSDLQQAKESVLLLHQAGITLTDIKPANFVKLTGSGTNGDMEETVKRVVAIDLEGFWKDASHVELPGWLSRQDTPLLLSCGDS